MTEQDIRSAAEDIAGYFEWDGGKIADYRVIAFILDSVEALNDDTSEYAQGMRRAYLEVLKEMR